VLTISFHKNQIDAKAFNQSIKLLIYILSESLARKRIILKA